MSLQEKVEERSERDRKFQVLEEEQPEEQNRSLELQRVPPEVKCEVEKEGFLQQRPEKK